MQPTRVEYQGHRIELRESGIAERSTDESGRLMLLIDDEPVDYDQLPDGSYALHRYAYDWSDDLVDLARKFIDYEHRGR